MKVGDKFKIVEKISHQKIKTTIGEITEIDKFKVTIIIIKNNQKTFKTSYNIADFRDKNKTFFIRQGREWIPTKIKVTEYLEGQRVVL